MPETVKVPEQFAASFEKAEAFVRAYFSEKSEDPARGTIEVAGERYILVRAASMSVEFFDTIAELYRKEGAIEARNIARQMLFDIAHAIGRQDARNFHARMGFVDPVEKLSAGPIHFAHTGWASVDIFPESSPSPDESYYLIYDHPYSFESAAWIAADRKANFPVCVMNAGYSSGWCEESFGLTLVASEVTCRAKGDDACRFIMAPPERIEDHIGAYLKKTPELAKRAIGYEVPGFFRRKAMEDELHYSQARLQLQFERMPIGCIVWDTDFRVTSWNPAATAIFGYTAEEALGRHPHEFLIAEAAKAETTEIMQRLLEGDATAQSSNENITRDGRRILCEWINTPLRKGNNVIGAMSMVQDVTERDADRRALEASEQKLRAILDATVDGILVADGSSHTFVLGNPAICRMLGYRAEELSGLGVEDIHPPESLAEVRQQFERQLRGEIQVAESLPVQRKDGSVFYADVSGSPVRTDGKEYLVGVFHDVSDRRLQEEKIERLNALLLAIRLINEHLLVADSEKGLFQLVCDTLQTLDHFAGVCIGLKLPDKRVDIVAHAGFDAATAASLDIRWDDSPRGQGTMGVAIRQQQPDVDGNLAKPRHGPWREVIEQYNLTSAAAMPLLAEGEVLGAMAVYADSADIFDDAITRFLAEVAGDIALGVRTLRLNRKLKATLKSLRRSMDGTIEAVAGMVELRDPYTAGHEQRVGRLSEAIGKEMGLPERQVEGLRVTGYIHDIGKISVPAEILSKPSGLNEHEFALIKEHARIGFELLKGLDFPWPVAEAVLQHHERLDGSGYPQGLKGEEIILEARILMVADVVESMAGHRPYRPAHGIEKALLEIITHKGKLYDADVVDACVQLFTEKKFSLQPVE